MRRYWQGEPPRRTFRGTELPRLVTGVVMLAVLLMLIVRAGDPDTWRWLVRDGGKRPAGALSRPRAAIPTIRKMLRAGRQRGAHRA